MSDERMIRDDFKDKDRWVIVSVLNKDGELTRGYSMDVEDLELAPPSDWRERMDQLEDDNVRFGEELE